MKNLFTFLFAITIVNSFAQRTDNPYDLLLKSGPVTTTENLEEFIRTNQVQQNEVIEGRYYRYIQFYQTPTNETKVALKSDGVELLAYVPNKTWVAAIKENFNASKLSDYNIRSVFEIAPTHKLSQTLAEGAMPEWALEGTKHINLIVKYYSNLSYQTVKYRLLKAGAEITDMKLPVQQFNIKVNVEDLNKYASMAFISYIEPIDPPSYPENLVGRTDHRSNWMAADYDLGNQYDGTGINIMMQDDGVIGPHIDYEGRTQHHTTGNSGDHGDHVAGTIMGAGNLDPTTRGMAFGSFLHVYGSSNNNYDSVPNLYTNNNVPITSKSYSNGCNAGYTSLAQQLDQQVRTYENLMHVFSAGNSGTSNCGYGAGAGWGNVTGGHKIGKNVIACANLTYQDNLANSSSRGPAHDGRIKPDISAVGTSVYSTVDVNDYAFKTGTSMSCPGVAGTLAQLYHAFDDITGNLPKGGLAKSILQNSADDLGNAGPDYKYGYGRINGRRALSIIEDANHLTSSITQSAQNTHNITVPSGTGQVRVMLYWTDYEATVNSSIALVNDLNMVVTDPNNTDYNPWVMDETPNSTTLDLPATRQVDDLNNMEQFTLNNPTPGTYTVEITGFDVPQGPQEYFINWVFVDADDITVTYPNGGEGFNPGETETIRWDAYGNTSSFTLEYSVDNGNNWLLINSNVNASQRYFDWTVPSALTGQALVRVTRGSFNDESNAVLSIIGVPDNLNVDWACPDSCQLSWDPVTGATGYEVSMLGNKYMDSVGVSTTTSHVITGINPIDPFWFSVKALGPTNAIGRRAIAIEKSPGVFNCVIAVDAEIPTLTGVSSTMFDCQDNSAVPVSIDITNNGQSNITNVPVYYRINNGTPVSETYTGTIAPTNTDSYTFTQTADLSTIGSYTVEAWCEYPSDGNSFNDTVVKVANVVNGVAMLPPVTENFESFFLCPETIDCGATVCNLANDWVNEESGTADDIDWRTDEDGTPSNFTGPAIDFDPGTDFGNYLYTEASGGCDGMVASLQSPCIDLTSAGDPELTFAYFMEGQDMGELHLDILAGGVWTQDVITPIVGDQGGNWLTATVDLNPYTGKIINLRWRGITGTGYRSDLALDAISIIDDCPKPIAGFSAATNNLQVTFTNTSTADTAWFWDFGDSNSNTVENPTHNYASSGTYNVMLIAYNSCGTDTFYQDVTITDVGLKEDAKQNGIIVYPNPNKGTFTFEVKDQAGDLAINITDAQGRLVYNYAEQLTGGLKQQINLDSKASGIYFLNVSLNDKQYHIKLSVE